MKPIKQNPGAYFVAFRTYLTTDSNRDAVSKRDGRERFYLNLCQSEFLYEDDVRKNWTPYWSGPVT